MTALEQLRRLWDHCAWADAALLVALEIADDLPAAALKEYAHVIGAEEVWLSRVEGRPATVPVWPDLALSEVRALAERVRAGYSALLATLDGARLTSVVAYTNTTGRSFETPLIDILLHVMLHAQYHRGKVNLLLRQADLAPAPVDYIGFVRGVPAATTAATLTAGPA
jgi:uncharacterized damage-inducible protein DinB